jgi:glutamate racemase
MGAEVNLVSSAEETAKDLYKVLADNDLLRLDTSSPTLSFRATGDASAFEKLARRFLGPEVSTVEKL